MFFIVPDKNRSAAFCAVTFLAFALAIFSVTDCFAQTLDGLEGAWTNCAVPRNNGLRFDIEKMKVDTENYKTKKFTFDGQYVRIGKRQLLVRDDNTLLEGIEHWVKYGDSCPVDSYIRPEKVSGLSFGEMLGAVASGMEQAQASTQPPSSPTYPTYPSTSSTSSTSTKPDASHGSTGATHQDSTGVLEQTKVDTNPPAGVYASSSPTLGSAPVITSADTYVSSVSTDCISMDFNGDYHWDRYRNNCGQTVNVLVMFSAPNHHWIISDLAMGKMDGTGHSREDYKEFGGNPRLYVCPSGYIAVDSAGRAFFRDVNDFKCKKL